MQAFGHTKNFFYQKYLFSFISFKKFIFHLILKEA